MTLGFCNGAGHFEQEASCGEDTLSRSASQAPPSVQPASGHAAAQATRPGLPDAEGCLAAAIVAGRTEDLEVAIRFAVRSMATADPDQTDVTQVHPHTQAQGCMANFFFV